ncbi:MAG TPA: CarD family transcriptional regulator, partial [Solirubrobacteraceae bacterium]|nr:CarD family transcriptional regulator [Solirubrobacteraceae bacterium]
MSLRPLLAHLDDTPDGATLAREGGRAFVSASLRPYLIAALVDGVDSPAYAGRPALVVSGDDRQARDLAADLRAWLAPRPVRFYPSRGVAYESHLAPPPHLVGLRVAALDALMRDEPEGEAPVVVVSAVALSEKVPDPQLRPRSLGLAVGDLVDLDELAGELVAAGYERVEQVTDRGQFAVRGGIVDLFPATEDRAIRAELFDIEVESLRWFSTFTQRSLGEASEVEIAAAAELAPRYRHDMGEGAARGHDDDRPDIAELLPVDRFASFLDLAGDAAVVLAAEEDVEPALRDHWQDVCAAFHDTDAHHLYVPPGEVSRALDERAAVRLSAIAADQPLQFRAQAADTAARSLKEAEPELEKLVRSGYRTVVTWPRKGEGDRAAYNLARVKAEWLGSGNGSALGPERVRFAAAALRDGFVAGGLKLAVIPEHRLFRRRRAEPSGPEVGGRRRGALRSFADLRTGDIVVHEDHGIARFAVFDTRTVAGTTRDYLQLEFHGEDRVYMPVDQLAKISRYVGAGGAHPPLSKLGGSRWETIKSRARRAAQELAGELLNL